MMKRLVLDATNKSISVVMSGAPATTQPDFTSHWADATTTTFTEGSSDGTLNGTTPVTLVAAPAASTRRVVVEITIINRDTAAITITVSLIDGANTRQMQVCTLQVGDSWTLDGVYDKSGNLKSTADLSTAVILLPTTSSRNTIQPSADLINLIVKAFAGQASNLFEGRDSSGNSIFTFTPTSRLGLGSNLVPSQRLHIYDTAADPIAEIEVNGTSFVPTVQFRASRTGTANLATNDVIGLLDFWGRDNGTTESMALIRAIYTGSGTTRLADFVFYNANAGAPVEHFRITAAGQGLLKCVNADTNVVFNSLVVGHNTSGTPLASYGTAIDIQGQDSTTVDQDMGRLRALWIDPAHATRKADVVLSAFDNGGERDGLKIHADGTGAVTETMAGERHALRVVTGAGAITVTNQDYQVIVNKASGAATTVNLPAGIANQTFIIKDGKGDAFTNAITITPAAGNIDGATTFIMNVNYQAVMLVYNGTQWNIINNDVPGSGGGMKQVEVDFGAIGSRKGVFTVTDVAVAATSKLICLQAGDAPTGKSQDENEMDNIDFTAAPGSGQFTLYGTPNEGPVIGKFKVNYMVA